MSYLKINVDDENKAFIEQLLHKLGFEVIEEPEQLSFKENTKEISPTMLFGKWKNIEIDPKNYRKQVWGRK
ncbi:MAG: hypothetical protein SFW35_05940 [Chitinophagales bacterium]|nr:hypothetical protein [Chitinophagales bacterium]